MHKQHFLLVPKVENNIIDQNQKSNATISF